MIKKKQITKLLSILILMLFVCFLFKCQTSEENTELKFVVKDFNALTNWEQKNEEGLYFLELDYTGALKGFQIPSEQQLADGFKFEFKIKNLGNTTKTFFYKIYFQNDSYKFSEFDASNPQNQHPLADENFYGSKEDYSPFLQTSPIPNDGKFHNISTFLRIAGNPRNEKRYYNDSINDRWKRNPRVGNYKFMLVVCEEDVITQKIIPPDVQDITLSVNDKFTNPFHYFIYGNGKDLNNTKVIQSEAILKVVAKPNFRNGVYFHSHDFPDTNKYELVCELCNGTPEFKENAHFAQFSHYVNEASRFENIPVIRDVINENYTLEEYNWNKVFFRKEELISTTPQTADRPCRNVYYDKEKDALVIMNPKASYGNWKKENAGVRTLHSFTYGTYTLKANLTRLLSNGHVWNGIVNTMWLLNESNDEWNRRRICNKEGYLENYWGGQNDKRVPYVSYSEIDFEILKTVSYCPPHQFPPAYLPAESNRYDLSSWNRPLPEELENEKDKIIVACTNWDMACWEPSDFGVGCNPIEYNGKTFLSHRWDHWYRAITQKSPESDKELFDGAYFFQIEWKPEEIIWRIGPDRDNMRVVGYMNSTITSIPNNQMFLIITQEFHNSKWWVGAPFHQNYIPFPKNDIKGYIYELTIE
ncbi:MAG: hypothetical protein PHT69_07650 [Bacteroidales bacterium]|nr:hypothetical protein [Bacteroidales bacterium]